MTRTFTVGQATVSVISIGDVTLPIAAAMGRDLSTLRDDALLRQLADQVVIPLQSVLIRARDTIVLVDAGLYDVAPESEYAVREYTPPPSLVAGLAQLGVGRDDVEHVVITHRHWDHFNGTAIDGSPTFPRAQHYIQCADWTEMMKKFEDKTSRESRSIAHVRAAGLITCLEGDHELAPDVRIIAAPGETPGHQIVRLQSGSPKQTFYALGDLYHHPVEFARPEWMVSWADPVTTAVSRRRLVSNALRERATLAASHIAAIGRLSGSQASPLWHAVE